MLKCTVDREKVEYLNTIVRDKNNLSLLNRFDAKELPKESLNELEAMGVVDTHGNLLESARPAIHLLANPYALVKMVFTGGVGSYEHCINYDHSLKNHVSFTMTPNEISIDDETNPRSVLKVLEDFVGKSNLKSINVSQTFDVAEALVVASMLDMERKTSLRAFVDEIPFARNSYNTNMIWRIINSTSTSIQWFVYVINEVIGEHVPLSQQQVQTAIDQLVNKGLVTHHSGQYQLSNEFSLLSNRMIIIDNILSVQTSKQDDRAGVVNAGFTCMQSGVHDLLFLDYNGKEIMFETISSVRLLDYIERFLNCETYFSQMQA